METPVSPKITVATAAGAIVLVIVWLVSLLNIDVPSMVQGALVVIVMAVAGWFKKDPLRNAGAAAVNAPPEQPVGQLPLVAAAKAALKPSVPNARHAAGRDPRDGEVGAVSAFWAILMAIGLVLALMGLFQLLGVIAATAGTLALVSLVAGAVILAVALVVNRR